MKKTQKLADKIKREKKETLDRMWDRVFQEALEGNIYPQGLVDAMTLLNEWDIQELGLWEYFKKSSP